MTDISILLPTHNRHATLLVALQSLQAQSFQNWEVLVTGDGCSDGSADMVTALARSDPRIRWFDLPKGPHFGYNNRNTALREARGELIGFLADDDLYFPYHLERLVAMMSDDGAHLGVSAALWVDSSGQMIPVVAPLHDIGYRSRFLEGENRICASSFIHRRAAFKEVGFWREDLPSKGDLDLWQRIIGRYGEGSIRTDHRCSVVHFRAPWKREGIDLNPHDHHLWQRLIHDQRVEPELKIVGEEQLLQQQLWRKLADGPGIEANCLYLELAAGRTTESFAHAAMQEMTRLHRVAREVRKRLASSRATGEKSPKPSPHKGDWVAHQVYEDQVQRAEKWKAKQREALARSERWKARAEKWKKRACQ